MKSYNSPPHRAISKESKDSTGFQNPRIFILALKIPPQSILTIYKREFGNKKMITTAMAG
jgi:hypothetical protein